MIMRTTNPLAGLLRKSPFKPIQVHMRSVFSCVMLLPALFDAVYRKDQKDLRDLAEQIDKSETEADKMKSEYRRHMPKTLLLPVDRRDLLNLLNEQDAIADGVEKVSQILVSRDMVIPDAIKEGFDELLEGTMEIITQAKTMIEELDELVHVGFSGKENDRVEDMIKLVRREEHNIDMILKKVNRTLFTIEKELDPVSVIFWYKVIAEVGNISDRAENMADRLLLFLSK
ncbi:MAG: TIGR00153 family protein [Desulfocapsa sp.]|nr:TIGR00153 family protein [Desulfocapsa sp.]